MKANSKTKAPVKTKKAKQLSPPEVPGGNDVRTGKEVIPDAPDGMTFPKIESNPRKVIIPEMTTMLKSDFSMNPEFRDEPRVHQQPQQQAQQQDPPPSEIKVYQVHTSIEEAKVWGTLVQVTPWVNGTGYEVILCNKNGAFQHMSITKEEIELVNEMIKRLSRT